MITQSCTDAVDCAGATRLFTISKGGKCGQYYGSNCSSGHTRISSVAARSSACWTALCSTCSLTSALAALCAAASASPRTRSNASSALFALWHCQHHYKCTHSATDMFTHSYSAGGGMLPVRSTSAEHKMQSRQQVCLPQSLYIQKMFMPEGH